MSDTRARYENLDHNLLYSMVMDGDPEQVDKLAAKWNSLKTDMNNLATALNNDLAGLATSLRASIGVLAGEKASSSKPEGPTPRGEATIKAVTPHLAKYWKL